MGRIHYLIRLIIRIVFVFLCFVTTFVFTAVVNYQTDGISLVDSLDTTSLVIVTKNGASVEKNIKDGILELNILQDGTEYDDIFITMKINPIKYDTTFLEKMMGKYPKYEEYIEDMKTGPWSAEVKYRLMGNSTLTTGNNSYSIRYNDVSATQSLSSKLANENNTTEEIMIVEDDEFSFSIVMGANGSGALPAGKYYLYAELDISGLYGLDNPKLSFAESIPAFASIAIDSLKTISFDKLFSVGSWLTFYFLVVVAGCIFFAYPDLRTAFKLGTSGKGTTKLVKITTFLNGNYHSSEMVDNGLSGVSILVFVITYVFMLFTIPIRLLAQIINSLIHIIKGDDYSDSDPIFANILGSIGIYALLFAVMGIIGATSGSVSYIPSIVAGVIGIVLLVVAIIWSKKKEDLA